MLVYRVADAFAEGKVDYAIAGGQALGLHGAGRATFDLDIVLRWTKVNLAAAEQALGSVGLQSRLPLNARDVFEFREEYMRNKNLLAWSFWNPGAQNEVVDLLVAHDLAAMKTKTFKAQGHLLRVVSVDDLIAMKRKSGRPQDLEDIRALEYLKKR